jgi:hypothetical protein
LCIQVAFEGTCQLDPVRVVSGNPARQRIAGLTANPPNGGNKACRSFAMALDSVVPERPEEDLYDGTTAEAVEI